MLEAALRASSISNDCLAKWSMALMSRASSLYQLSMITPHKSRSPIAVDSAFAGMADGKVALRKQAMIALWRSQNELVLVMSITKNGVASMTFSASMSLKNLYTMPFVRIPM